MACWAAHATAPAQWAARRFGLEHGLPSVVVRSLARGADGFLWVGTEGGLVRFDGRSATAGEISAPVVATAVSRTGEIWVVGADGGLQRCTIEGVCRIVASLRDAAERGGSTRDLLAMAIDGDDRIWLASPDGHVRTFEGNSLSDVGPLLAVPPQLASTPDGTVWVVTRDHAPARLQRGQLNFGATAGDATSRLLPQLADGAICFSRRAADRLEVVDASGAVRWSVPRDPETTALWIDRYDRLWTLTANSLESWPLATELPEQTLALTGVRTVQAVLEDPSGAVWVATDAGLWRLTPEGVGWVEVLDPLQIGTGPAARSTGPDGTVWQLAPDRTVRIFVGVEERSAAPGQAGEKVLDLAASRRTPGWAWVITQRALYRIASAGPDAVREITPLDAPRTLLEDSSGVVWVATGVGLVRVGNDVVQRYGLAEGLPSEDLRGLAVDRHGTLWLATGGAGLVRFDGRTFEPAGAAASEKNVHALISDTLGNLWFADTRGLARLAPADRDEAPTTPIRYGADQGLPECAADVAPARTMSESRLVFSCRTGMIVVDPARALAAEIETPTVAIDTRRARLDRTRCEIPFSVLALRHPEWVRCRYRIEPLDADWIDAGDERTIRYTNLPAGQFTLRLQAASATAPFGQNEARLPLTFVAQWHESWLMRGALALGALLLVVLFARRVARRESPAPAASFEPLATQRVPIAAVPGAAAASAPLAPTVPGSITTLAETIAPSIEASAPAPTEASIPVPARPPLPQHPTVLLVDDNAAIRSFLKGQLVPRFVVIEAADGEEALEKARKLQPHVVVTDGAMPKLDGASLCRALDGDPDLASIATVLLDEPAAGETAADACLPKPFTPEQLQEAIDRVLA